MKKIYKKILLLVIAIYFVFILISQQKTLNSYKAIANDYNKELEQAKLVKEELINTKKNVSSLDYIEEIAREKLDMYLPNERIYVDADK